MRSDMVIENMKRGLYHAVTDIPGWYGIKYSYLFVPSDSGVMNGSFVICYQSGAEKGVYFYNSATSTFDKI